MNENQTEMLLRHKKEIRELQEGCQHKMVIGWIDYYWAPGHLLGRARICTFCGKVIEQTWPTIQEQIENGTSQETTDSPEAPDGV